jgi:hypothetical protein
VGKLGLGADNVHADGVISVYMVAKGIGVEGIMAK